jgi:hypothetical protein
MSKAAQRDEARQKVFLDDEDAAHRRAREKRGFVMLKLGSSQLRQPAVGDERLSSAV